MHNRLIKGEQKLFGVCSGIGNYLDIDPTIIRILFAVAAVFFGTGILLYLILAVVMPSR
jgi:phage shock protein C